MRRLIIGAAVVTALAAILLTVFCNYIVIENPADSASIGPPTYKLESFEP